ncbi:MAG: DNA repair protein RecN [Firmicutes bacterium ADurb.Bin182]|nr:MAG: DNA repair protein RecN [Firmicutes bacterium ADurb.Bin182]
MLQRLLISNVALIEELDVELSKGFNVLTGETGAGKSIVIDAVNLVLGERANRDLIKFGASKACVQAVFDIEQNQNVAAKLREMEMDSGSKELILAREISANGRNICRINGTLVPLTTLKEVSDLLVDVHGQHEHQSLLIPSSHIRYLDAFAFDKTGPIKEKLSAVSKRCKEIKTRLLSGFVSEAERARRIDILNFQISEIEQANIASGEDGLLMEERTVLQNAGRIMNALESSYSALNAEESGALSALNKACEDIAGISQFKAEYADISNKLYDLYYALEDINFMLRDYKAGFDFDESRLDAIENRLDLIAALKRKYGSGIDEILEYKNRCVRELEELNSGEQQKEFLQKEFDSLSSEYRELSEELSAIRRKSALLLEKSIIEQLEDLGLSGSRFEIKFERTDAEFSESGIDKVEFLLSTNAGEPPKPFSRVASGGEVSRIMLALKTVLALSDDIPTLIFDEIDTGVSGRIATVVGEKMLHISQSHQVICVTHLPQIAALADSHYLAEKFSTDDSSSSVLRKLSNDERCQEVARIMGSDKTSDLALKHATEMIENAEKKKKQPSTN